MTCARGSSDHAAVYGKYLIWTKTGIPVAAAAPSVVSLYDAELSAQTTLCIAISQSGRSPDLLATVASMKAGGAHVVALVNDETSPPRRCRRHADRAQGRPRAFGRCDQILYLRAGGAGGTHRGMGRRRCVARRGGGAPADLERAWALDLVQRDRTVAHRLPTSPSSRADRASASPTRRR
ncbi:SIS domain-containing protein [Sphingomonas aerolata]|uniref:SIS domain-containing protein n=1 Tax=Sphingomonas aerolata TaxID=185951 RepID=UPI002FE046E5